ncbi:ribosome hibernation-promoting factor, HPF/YfiA family [Patiriisocius hiemis]|uniref:Ribosome-associated translation inhibitor RaiA n=1 Tax=Patiriisocius hiemis TaxID=3075604 RepID=A0ABU2YDD3_9FLAO|nr:ribosome-associated translation inhibitor RaiA [Constantimarinum sp. W242]MDT0556173.1 ribosome-associated translation inhibitor RaiA [Constantimarinum sp. W242]
MTINIQFVKMKTSETMSSYVTKKLQKLAKKYNWVIRADVFFKIENDPTERGHICEIELSLPGPKIFAVSNEKNYEMAVKETIGDLDKQLKKRKAKFTKQNISS